MTYDFDAPIDRSKTGSIKWNVSPDEVPMWIADMDFKTADPIVEGFKSRIKSGIYGYTEVGMPWRMAYVDWWQERHGFAIDPDWLLFSAGVIPSVSSIVRRVTEIANNVVVLSPVYDIFYHSILNNGRHLLPSPLIYSDGRYAIDWKDLESKLALEETSLLILCNPHNPIGKLWSREDLIRIADLCAAHHVTVLSDEIHCDLVAPGSHYVPFLSVSDTAKAIGIMTVSPTKAFNLAGIQTSAIVIPNPVLRHLVDRGINTSEVAEPNVLAAIAPILAFGRSGDWLDQVNAYIEANRTWVKAVLTEQLPDVKLASENATYLLWLDVSAYAKDSDALVAYLRKKTGLILSSGRAYGPTGDGFVRMNIATQKSRVIDGLHRLKAGLIAYRADRNQ